MYKKFNERYLKPDRFELSDKDTNNKSIILFYGGVNVGKFPYVTHLRFSILGESIKNILKKVGYSVFSHPHTGDSSRYVGHAIAAIIHLEKIDINEILAWIDNRQITAKEIKMLHAKYLAEGDNPDKRKLHHNIQLKLSKNEPELIKIADKICEMEYPKIREFYQSIMVDFDIWEGEKDHEAAIADISQQAREKKILVENSSGQFVSVHRSGDKNEISPVMMSSNEGMHYFEACNMAVIYNTLKKQKATAAITICHRRFDLTFKRIHRAISSILPDTELKYLGVGVISKHDGKAFKDELGCRLPAEMFLERLYLEAKKIYHEGDANFLGFPISNEEDFKRIVIAVYKLYDLKHLSTKDYRFPMEGFFTTEALKELEIIKIYSEVVLQLARSQSSMVSHNMELLESTNPIAKVIEQYPKYLKQAAINVSPTMLVDYLSEFCSAYIQAKTNNMLNLPIKELEHHLSEVFTLLGIYLKPL